MKRIIMAVAAVILLGTSSDLNASQSYWEEHMFSGASEPDAAYYVIKPEANIACTVIYRREGEIKAIGYDTDWYGKTIEDQYEINSETGKVEDEFVMKGHLGRDEKFFPKSGYRVFPEKCAPLTFMLPERVRRSFGGIFGIR